MLLIRETKIDNQENTYVFFEAQSKIKNKKAFIKLPFTLKIRWTFVLGTKSNGILYGNSFRLLMTPEIYILKN